MRERAMAQGHAIAVAVNAAKKMCRDPLDQSNSPGSQQVNCGSVSVACAVFDRLDAMRSAAKASRRDMAELLPEIGHRSIDVDVENVRVEGNTLHGHDAVFHVDSEDL